MFDWLRDMKDQIGERMRSPLYAVFGLSWVISNWRPFYITIFESKETLGYSKIDFIYYILYPYDSWWTYGKLILWPVVATFIYIRIFPILVHWAFVQTETFKDARKQEKYKILKTSVVKGEVYLELKKKFDENLEKYARVIDDSSDSVTKIRELTVKNAELARELDAGLAKISDSESNIKFLKSTIEVQESILNNLKYGPSDIFSGYWESRYMSSAETGSEIFVILDGYKYVTVDTAPGFGSVPGPRHAFDIDRFVFNRTEKKVTFRKVGVDFNLGVILEVTLVENNVGFWEGEEVSVLIRPDTINTSGNAQTFGEPIKLSLRKVDSADEKYIAKT